MKDPFQGKQGLHADIAQHQKERTWKLGLYGLMGSIGGPKFQVITHVMLGQLEAP